MKNYVIVWKGGNVFFVPKFIHYQYLSEWDTNDDTDFCIKGFRLKYG